MRKIILKVTLLFLLFQVSSCTNGLEIKSHVEIKVDKNPPINVDGSILQSVKIYTLQKHYSIMETPPDRILKAEYYFENLNTQEKIYPADIMYVQTSRGLVRMPNIKAYTLTDNEAYYNNDLYFVFRLSSDKLLTDCKIGWMNDSAIYIAKWHPKEKKFIINHTSQYNYREWLDLDNQYRQVGKFADEVVFQLQHTVPFDCSKYTNPEKPLTAINLKEIE